MDRWSRKWGLCFSSVLVLYACSDRSHRAILNFLRIQNVYYCVYTHQNCTTLIARQRIFQLVSLSRKDVAVFVLLICCVYVG